MHRETHSMQVSMFEYHIKACHATTVSHDHHPSPSAVPHTSLTTSLSVCLNIESHQILNRSAAEGPPTTAAQPG